jgi:hypothetical protein
MENYTTITLLYILFIWLVIIHTFEEISQDIFDVTLGRLKLSSKKYLVGASIITTVNLGTLSLLVVGSQWGLYLGIFTSLVIGVLQALVHTIGYFKASRKPENLGAGFYSSLPLAAVGGVLLYHIFQAL